MDTKNVRDSLIEVNKLLREEKADEINAKIKMYEDLLINNYDELSSQGRELLFLTILQFMPDIEFIKKYIKLRGENLNEKELTILLLHEDDISNFARQYMEGKQIKIEEPSLVILPKEITYGIEIEGKNGHEFWDIVPGWTTKGETSIDNGQEITPITYFRGNNVADVRNIYYAFYMLQEYGTELNPKEGGGHVHIGADYLDTDDGREYEIMTKLWKKLEPVMIIIGNKEGELLRKEINRFARSVRGISVFTSTIQGDTIDKIKSNIVYELPDGDGTIDRNFTLNLSNLSSSFKSGNNTVEFRCSNEPEQPKENIENVNLFGNFVRVVREIADAQRAKEKGVGDLANVQRIIDSYESMLKTDDLEKILNQFLQLAFEEQKQRQIYINRYNANKELNDLTPWR